MLNREYNKKFNPHECARDLNKYTGVGIVEFYDDFWSEMFKETVTRYRNVQHVLMRYKK